MKWREAGEIWGRNRDKVMPLPWAGGTAPWQSDSLKIQVMHGQVWMKWETFKNVMTCSSSYKQGEMNIH